MNENINLTKILKNCPRGLSSTLRIRKDCIYFEEKEENKDKCSDCPFNDTSCPGGMWCTED